MNSGIITMIKILRRSLLFFPLLFLFSCREKIGIQNIEFYDFGKKGMLKNVEYIFNPFNDSIVLKDDKDYKVALIIRYSDECQVKSLPLNIEYASLVNDSIKEKKIVLPLFDEQKYNNGKSNFGVYESEYLLFERQAPEDGFFISIVSPTSDIEGLLSLGIILKN